MTDHRTPLLDGWGKRRRRRRGPSPASVAAILAAGLAAALAVSIWSVRTDRGRRPPSGLEGSARCTLGDGLSGWCGRVTVPTSGSDRRIALRVAILPSTRRAPLGALFYLEGGPGHAATAAAPEVGGWFARVNRDRDIVMVDQRGTGGSGARGCGARRVAAADARDVAAYVRRCLERLGAATRDYGTAAAADDVDAVRTALGYAPIDVYGGSYGATLAQVLLARHPRAVRTVVLDGGSLLDVHLYERSAANQQHAYDAVVRRCAESPPCASAYPRLGRDLHGLLARRPRRVTTELGSVELTRADVESTLALLLESSADAALVPSLVHSAAAGDLLPLGRAYLEHHGRDLEPAAHLAMFWTILCSESWARSDPAATAHQGRGSSFTAAAVARARVFTHACRAAHLPPVPVPRVATDVPALLLSGAADPLDPPANLRGWRGEFRRGRLLVVPAGAHGAIDDQCIQTVVARFVAHGRADIDSSCVGRIRAAPIQTG